MGTCGCAYVCALFRGASSTRGGGINGRYQLTECPHHRQFQPLVQRFSQDISCVPFLVGVLHYRMYIVVTSKYSGGSNLSLR